MKVQDRILGALWGGLVGDALGVPFEFRSREELKQEKLFEMIGYGTWNQPPGTWSDDGSLMLCTVEGLIEDLNIQKLASLFLKWKTEGYWSARGEVFDIGNTTSHSLDLFARGVSAENSGMKEENSNGNGSLMRILPVGLRYYKEEGEKIFHHAAIISSITHGHERSKIACGIYSLLVADLLNGEDPGKSLERIIQFINHKGLWKNEEQAFQRLKEQTFRSLREENIFSSGYVIHTLEASIWCLLNTSNFREAVLSAVRLGGDTDTTGIVTAGLAGAYYGISEVPKEWIQKLPQHKKLEQLFSDFLIKPGLCDG